MVVHIEGMGVMGSLLAWKLDRRDIPFTWSDIDKPHHHAWKASTGLIYPSGDKVEHERGYETWMNIHYGGAPWRGKLRGITELGAYWFTLKHVPHGARDILIADKGALRMSVDSTVHVNVQALVQGTRDHFADRRSDPPPSGLRIVAHGFSERLDHVVWGWSALVRLRIAPEIVRASSSGLRPCFYLRTNRFTLRYALPKPGTDQWYAGSLTVPQRVPHDGDAAKHAAKWAGFVDETTQGMVQMTDMEEPVQGWRPAPSKAALAGAHHPLPPIQQGDRIILPPLALSGVRYSPYTAERVIALMTGAAV